MEAIVVLYDLTSLTHSLSFLFPSNSLTLELDLSLFSFPTLSYKTMVPEAVDVHLGSKEVF